MLLPNLTPDDVRLEPLDNGVRPIFWKRVDPYLATCLGAGDVTKLARHLKIARGTLLARRKKLELPKLKTGRPFARALTDRQQQVMVLVAKGLSMTKVAEELQVSRSTVRDARTAAEAKKRRECQQCNGKGVVTCNTCRGAGPHHHLCEQCKGDGYHE